MEDSGRNISIPTCESALDPDEILDNLLENYQTELREENRYIFETNYPLSKKHKVSVGLSAVRGFYPSIRLSSVCGKENIAFLINEWKIFIRAKEEILLAYGGFKPASKTCPKCSATCGAGEEEKKDGVTIELFEGCCITVTVGVRYKVFRINYRGTSIRLSKKEFDNLCGHSKIVEDRVFSLENNGFLYFYYNVILDGLAEMGNNKLQ